MNKQNIRFFAIGAAVVGALALIPEQNKVTVRYAAPDVPVVAEAQPKKTAERQYPNKPAKEQMECVRKVRRAQMVWYYNETGMTTTAFSGDAPRYAEMMKASGLQTKTPIPSASC